MVSHGDLSYSFKLAISFYTPETRMEGWKTGNQQMKGNGFVPTTDLQLFESPDFQENNLAEFLNTFTLGLIQIAGFVN